MNLLKDFARIYYIRDCRVKFLSQFNNSQRITSDECFQSTYNSVLWISPDFSLTKTLLSLEKGNCNTTLYSYNTLPYIKCFLLILILILLSRYYYPYLLWKDWEVKWFAQGVTGKKCQSWGSNPGFLCQNPMPFLYSEC